MAGNDDDDELMGTCRMSSYQRRSSRVKSSPRSEAGKRKSDSTMRDFDEGQLVSEPSSSVVGVDCALCWTSRSSWNCRHCNAMLMNFIYVTTLLSSTGSFTQYVRRRMAMV